MLPRMPSGRMSCTEAWPTSSRPWPAVCREATLWPPWSGSTTVEKSKSGTGGTNGSNVGTPVTASPSSPSSEVTQPATRAARRDKATRARMLGEPGAPVMNIAVTDSPDGPGFDGLRQSGNGTGVRRILLAGVQGGVQAPGRLEDVQAGVHVGHQEVALLRPASGPDEGHVGERDLHEHRRGQRR